MPKISLIVPIYNVADYLEQCVRSILAQTENNIEIVLVNDGSTDGSSEICKRYEAIDRRIIYIEIRNGGVGRARNIGMERATGEWLCFVDGDDYLPEDALEKLLDRTKETVRTEKSDIIIGNYCTDKDGKITSQRFVREPYIQKENQYTYEHLQLIGNAIGCRYYGASSTSNIGVPWARLYRRQFCMEAGLSYPTIKRMQDTLFNINAFQKTNRISFISENVYFYRLTENSAVNRYTPDFKGIANEFLRYLKEMIWANEEQRMKELYQFKKLGLLIENIKLSYAHPLCQMTMEEKIKGIQTLCEDYKVAETYGIANKRLFSGKQKIILSLLVKKQYIIAYYFFGLKRCVRW